MKSRDRALAEVMVLHDDVDAQVKPLVAFHAERLQCRRGCNACCVDDLTVFDVEAERIRTHCSDVLASEPHPTGACAFLDGDGACRIYADRPYVCRTQGLPLRWFAEDEGSTPNRLVELRDICPLNESDTPLEGLPDASCWLIGPTEDRLSELEASVGSGDRVALRDLFQTTNR